MDEGDIAGITDWTVSRGLVGDSELVLLQGFCAVDDFLRVEAMASGVEDDQAAMAREHDGIAVRLAAGRKAALDHFDASAVEALEVRQGFAAIAVQRRIEALPRGTARHRQHKKEKQAPSFHLRLPRAKHLTLGAVFTAAGRLERGDVGGFTEVLGG